jgi:cytochrome P450
MLFQGLEQQRGAAMTAEVDFTSQAFFRDPAAGVERLRALGPVVETRFPIVGKVWITTTYEATARVLKDGDLPGCAGGCRRSSPRSPTTC